MLRIITGVLTMLFSAVLLAGCGQNTEPEIKNSSSSISEKASSATSVSKIKEFGQPEVNNPEELKPLVQTAVKKNRTLDNGQFTVLSIIENTEERIEDTSTGVFIKKNDGTYNWYYQNYAEDGSLNSEYLSLNGQQYQRFLDSQAQQSEWQPMDTKMTVDDIINSLFNFDDFNFSDADIETTREAGSTVYLVAMNGTYAEMIKKVSVSALEQTLTTYEETGTDQETLTAINNEMKEIQQTEYSSDFITYEINDAGYLVKITISVTLTPPGGEPQTITDETILNDYNVENEENLLPALSAVTE